MSTGSVPEKCAAYTRALPAGHAVSPTHESPGIEAYAVRGYPRNRLTERPADEVVVTKTTQSRGFKISYDDAGQGPVIVLIPGLTMPAAD